MSKKVNMFVSIVRTIDISVIPVGSLFTERSYKL